MGAGPCTGDLLYGTTEVDVDDVCADRLDHPGRVTHRPWVRAEELDRQGMLVGGHAEVAEGLLVAMLDARTAHHLGANEARAVPPPLASEGLDAHAGHGGEHESGRHFDPADAPGSPEVDHGSDSVLADC